MCDQPCWCSGLKFRSSPIIWLCPYDIKTSGASQPQWKRLHGLDQHFQIQKTNMLKVSLCSGVPFIILDGAWSQCNLEIIYTIKIDYRELIQWQPFEMLVVPSIPVQFKNYVDSFISWVAQIYGLRLAMSWPLSQWNMWNDFVSELVEECWWCIGNDALDERKWDRDNNCSDTVSHRA